MFAELVVTESSQQTTNCSTWTAQQHKVAQYGPYHGAGTCVNVLLDGINITTRMSKVITIYTVLLLFRLSNTVNKPQRCIQLTMENKSQQIYILQEHSSQDGQWHPVSWQNSLLVHKIFQVFLPCSCFEVSSTFWCTSRWLLDYENCQYYTDHAQYWRNLHNHTHKQTVHHWHAANSFTN